MILIFSIESICDFFECVVFLCILECTCLALKVWRKQFLLCWCRVFSHFYNICFFIRLFLISICAFAHAMLLAEGLYDIDDNDVLILILLLSEMHWTFNFSLWVFLHKDFFLQYIFLINFNVLVKKFKWDFAGLLYAHIWFLSFLKGSKYKIIAIRQ